jgi:hypothetical protein
VQRRCDTCAKKVNEHRCAVLTDMVGRKGECWAWTDDPGWEEKVKAAVEAYAGRAKVRGSEAS